MRSIHLPVWLASADLPRANSFAMLFAVAAFTRAALITVVPLEAYRILGGAQQVSVFYFGISLIGVLGSLAVPWLAQKIRRRRVLSLAGLAFPVGAAFMATGTPGGLILGMAVHVWATASMEITLNLYVMDHIPRKELGRFEPRRVFFAAGSWVVGPWFGVWLQGELAAWAPFALSGAAGVVLVGYFWYLRLTEHPGVAPAKAPPSNPLIYLPQFFRQPRLRLAWVLAVGRSGWWSMFFIYAPIYAVTAGLGAEVGGAMVSIGAASFFIVPLWGLLGRRYGMRRILIAGYLVAGAMTVAVALAAGIPWLGAVALVATAFLTAMIDSAGNVPFLRAVHPLERSQMTTVFTTYRDVAQLAPPGVFAVLLKVFELPVIFVAGGLGMLTLAYYARYLPRRL